MLELPGVVPAGSRQVFTRTFRGGSPARPLELLVREVGTGFGNYARGYDASAPSRDKSIATLGDTAAGLSGAPAGVFILTGFETRSQPTRSPWTVRSSATSWPRFGRGRRFRAEVGFHHREIAPSRTGFSRARVTASIAIPAILEVARWLVVGGAGVCRAVPIRRRPRLDTGSAPATRVTNPPRHPRKGGWPGRPALGCWRARSFCPFLRPGPAPAAPAPQEYR